MPRVESALSILPMEKERVTAEVLLFARIFGHSKLYPTFTYTVNTRTRQ